MWIHSTDFYEVSYNEIEDNKKGVNVVINILNNKLRV